MFARVTFDLEGLIRVSGGLLTVNKTVIIFVIRQLEVACGVGWRWTTCKGGTGEHGDLF